MSEPVMIVGLGADGLEGLSPSALHAVETADFLAGGRRHLGLVGPTGCETFMITDNVDALVSRLSRRGSAERCVVLASGDPLFFGVGHRIGEALGRDQIRVETAVSSLQRAFARLGLSWHDAEIATIHGRPLTPTLLPLLGCPKIGLFTRDGESPSEVARVFIGRGLADAYHAWVCQNLGSAEEKVIESRLSGLVGRRFADLNFLVLLRDKDWPFEVLEINDDAFAGPTSGPLLLTHADIRAMVLRRFRGTSGRTIWDIGAGLGGVSVELARAFPGNEVVAVERSPIQVEFLKANRLKFGAFNVRILEGEAPGCLEGEEPPSGVFLGGSGGRLDSILSIVTDRLRPDGRFVANFVGLENLVTVLDRLRALGWRTEMTQASVSEGRPLAGLTTLVPLRPVWIVHARKP